MSVLDTSGRALISVSQANSIAKKVSTSLVVESTIDGFSLTNIGHGNGCCAYIIKIEFYWTNNDEKLPKSVIIKVLILLLYLQICNVLIQMDFTSHLDCN